MMKLQDTEELRTLNCRPVALQTQQRLKIAWRAFYLFIFLNTEFIVFISYKYGIHFISLNLMLLVTIEGYF